MSLSLVVVHLVHGDDVFVADLRRGPGFAAKAGDGQLVLAQFGIQHLDGHVALQAGIDGMKDHAHAAPADHADDFEVGQAPQVAAVLGWIQKGE